MTQKVNKIYFRADGDKTIGLGHVIRSLALAEMLQHHYECHFLTTSNLHFLKDQILDICQSLTKLPKQENLEKEAIYIQEQYLNTGAIIILDGYHFTTSYQETLRSNKNILIAIDDIHEIHFVADIIINHSGVVQEADYLNLAAPYTQFCLGTQYALLRKPFRELAPAIRSITEQKNVFICFGGADPQNHTLSIIKQLQNHHTFNQYFVVLGGAYSHRPALEAYIKSNKLPVQLLANLNANEMVAYMKKAQIAITPPSSISYEYLSVGGHLYLVQIADNQKSIKQFLIEKQLAFDFKDFGKTSTKTLATSVKKQQLYFDGRQAKRFLKIIHATQVQLYTAMATDCQQIYDWANHPSVRQQSFNIASIPFENHQKWFDSKLKDTNCHFYIGRLNGIPFGTIRFDIKNHQATISYSIAKQFRGQGLGTLLLKLGKKKLVETGTPLNEIIGFVKKENKASQFAFLKLDYQQTIAQTIENSYKFSLEV